MARAFAAIFICVPAFPLLAQFPAADTFNPGADGAINAITMQPDGEILVGGAFANLAGQFRDHIARLYADGSLDLAFNPGANNTVISLVVQADRKILVGGSFTSIAGQARSSLARLNPDGTLDGTFDPQANGFLNAVLVLPDGRILVGGLFTRMGGEATTNLARLKPDGSLDNGSNLGADSVVNTFAMQPDGKVLVGGAFSRLGAVPQTRLGRLNSDGTLDTGFSPGPGGQVYSLAVQADGQILVGGQFTILGTRARTNLARIDPTGTLDPGFTPDPNGLVSSLALQTDGKILVGGRFATICGQPHNSLARLNANGTLDTEFTTVGSNYVLALALQPDGRILLGGSFTNLAGQGRNRIGRLNNTDAPSEAVVFDGSTITWFRGGSGAEIWGAAFEASGNGRGWTSLGAATRIFESPFGRALGWQLTGLGLPADASLRLRGFLAGGYFDGSGSFVETVVGRPVFTVEPASRTDNFGASVAFTALAPEPTPRGYQWLKDGVAVLDGGNMAGATTSTLVISNVSGADARDYSLVAENMTGSSTSRVATLTVIDPLILVQPSNQSKQAGETVTFNAMATGTTQLSYQWYKDGVPLSQRTGQALTVTNLQETDAGSYVIVVLNQYGAVTSAVAQLTVNASTPEPGFSPRFTGQGSPSVLCLAVQADGKILVGGAFNAVDGQSCTNLARLNANGTLDKAFHPGVNDVPYCLAVQPDGSILAGGAFTAVGAYLKSRIVKLDANGTVDQLFNAHADGWVYSLALQADGKILAGGIFSYINSYQRVGLARLKPDGTLDGSLSTYLPSVFSVALQTDGRILAGGSFTANQSSPSRNHIVRFNADNSTDAPFAPDVNGDVASIAVQPDGKIIVGGLFTTLAGQPRSHIGRLNADGTLDPSFHPDASDSVVSLAVQADGKILVGGTFTMLAGQQRNRVGRLNPDGTLDSEFFPAADGPVNSLAALSDGTTLVGGAFAAIGGQPGSGLARLHNTDPVSVSLTNAGSALIWSRGGPGPEIWRSFFEISPDGGLTWTNLGGGSRIPGGWQLSGLSLPASATVRARGCVTGGLHDGSGWLVESVIGAPAFGTQPASRTNNFGDVVTLSVFAGGTEPLDYHWQKDGDPIDDGGKISGTTMATLTLSNVSGADAGNYRVVISNAYGAVTSAAAKLTVNDPMIIVQPLSQSRAPGVSVTFSVVAAGTPFLYQWWHGGTPLPGATNSTLGVANLEGADAGSYFVVLSNSFGNVTSVIAALNLATVDLAFNPQPFVSNLLYVPAAFAPRPDGKVLVGWQREVSVGASAQPIILLNADGSVDAQFGLNGLGEVNSLVALPEGKICVGGNLVAGPIGGIVFAKLNADGSLDGTFRPWFTGSGYPLALEADGSLIVGALVRLKSDGSLDAGFRALAPRIGGTVNSVAVQADGKIIIGGNFTSPDSLRTNILRLNQDGSLDMDFDPAANDRVRSLALQGDGRILVGRDFSGARGNLIRLNTNGTLDDTFNPLVGGAVYSIAAQTDGRIILGGVFTKVGTEPRNGLTRLNPDGTWDAEFNPGAVGFDSFQVEVRSLALQADGRILVGGSFSVLSGESRTNIARLNNPEPATQKLSFDGSAITWLRGGSSPEVWRTTFEYSTDGATWFDIGPGSRILGGWQLSGFALPVGGIIRARGYLTGGIGNGSAWFVESLLPTLAILTNDGNLGIASNGVSFSLRSAGGSNFVVESSPNLVNWTTIATNTMSNGTFRFFDPVVPLTSNRFYRAVLTP